jgi:pantoate--beta-alanine ligase
MQQTADRLRAAGKSIACVPTMGFLHEGHLSLMRIGRQCADVLVVSIFVNPTQFGPNEDFDTYPRNLDRDLTLCRAENVDVVFAPDKTGLYGNRFQTYVKLDHLPGHLCGLSRPVFFTGVATVVAKLFNIIKPHTAVFGQKDYQQLLVVRQMVQDLDFDVRVVGAPIVREPDGLAMSSRNAYLTDAQRPAALSLFKALNAAREMVASGVKDAARILAEAESIINRYPETQIDYVAICDPQTLEKVESVEGQALMALAVKVDRTRLIDNMLLNTDTR